MVHPVASDTSEVRQLLSAKWFESELAQLSDDVGRSFPDVQAEAAGYLRELASSNGTSVAQAWNRLGRWLLRAYQLALDEQQLTQLRELDREHSLIFLPSHRSYLDAWIPSLALTSRGVSPTFSFIGANLDFFPFGPLARRAGNIFVRRSTKDLPIYRFTLRAFIGQLVHNRANLGWSIEGGRTRTGKLRPPKYGILRYVIDAVEAVPGPEVLVIPVSIVYDQLHEVPMMASELRGAAKRGEDLRWLINFARQQSKPLGHVHFDLGEPLPLRQRIAELRARDSARTVERV
ncbi:MAG: 1-acyl-sn-glycerol-3-phosphate acyltransferase, partial [Mycobacterium sp.]